MFQFIRCLGVYPAGALVLLNNKRIAVVETVNTVAMDKPIVRVVYDTESQSEVEPYLVDLEAKTGKVSIEKAVDPAQTNLDLQALLRTAF